MLMLWRTRCSHGYLFSNGTLLANIFKTLINFRPSILIVPCHYGFLKIVSRLCNKKRTISYITLMGKSWILSVHLNKGKHTTGKSSYLKDAIMLPTINCDITKAATNATVDFSSIHKKWQKYLVTLKDKTS